MLSTGLFYCRRLLPALAVGSKAQDGCWALLAHMEQRGWACQRTEVGVRGALCYILGQCNRIHRTKSTVFSKLMH